MNLRIQESIPPRPAPPYPGGNPVPDTAVACHGASRVVYDALELVVKAGGSGGKAWLL